MRKTVCIFAALALSAIRLMADDATLAPNQPRIVCTAPVYDFGKVANTALVTHAYRISNEGAAPLVINRVDTGCGCTAAQFSTNAILPRESTDLTVRFDTANRSGSQRRAIYVQSNDRQNAILRLELIGELLDLTATNRRPVAMSIATSAIPVTVIASIGGSNSASVTLDFGKIKPGVMPEGQIIVAGEGAGEFRVSGVSSSCPHLAFCVESVERLRWRVTVRLLPIRPAGKGAAEIVIRTTNSAFGEIRVPVTWDALEL